MSSLEPGAVTDPGEPLFMPQMPVTASSAEGAQPQSFVSHNDATMSARRVAAFLNSLPTNRRQLVNLRWVVGKAVPAGSGYGDCQESHLESLLVRFDCVDLLGNVATFIEVNGDRLVFLPLDQIKTVWRKTTKNETIWEVSIVGSLHPGNAEWQLWPPS